MNKRLKQNLIVWLFFTLLVQHAAGQPLFYKVSQFDTLGLVQNFQLVESIQDSPENVLVVYNINYLADQNKNNVWDGYEIAAYYCEKRNIPSSNLVSISSPVEAEISRAEYDSGFDSEHRIIGIRQQIENILSSTRDQNGNLLRNTIKYIVLTKGIPYKIKAVNSSAYGQADYGSVDAAVALLFNGDYDIRWTHDNPYFYQDPNLEGRSPFIPEFYTNYFGLKLSYLVTRLDGYRTEDVKSMIDRAVRAGSNARNHTFVLDGAQKPYDHMAEAYQVLKSLGAQVSPDPWVDESEPILNSDDDVTGIITHGIHAGLPPDYLISTYDFHYTDGAVFSSYESYNAASFNPEINFSQGQIADFIKSGGSGGIGNVYEPYASNISREDIFLPAYYSGYTFAEAAYMSLNKLDWTAVVVGDPLMRIGPAPEPSAVQAFRLIRSDPSYHQNNLPISAVAELVFSQAVDLTKLPVFYSSFDSTVLNVSADDNYLYLWSAQPLPYNANISYFSMQPLYSQDGDSIAAAEFVNFRTQADINSPPPPRVLRSVPSGINVRQDQDIILFFSQKMEPETIFPLLGDPPVEQDFEWTDNRILCIKHPPFLEGTVYRFYLDAHAKSSDGLSLNEDYFINFETEYTFISFDLDYDGYLEYALNENNSLLDGYESYSDSAGVRTSVIERTDINADNQDEYLIGREGEAVPRYFWNPNAIPYTGYTALFYPLDDDEDGRNEYAVDAEGKGYFSKVYDRDVSPVFRDINFVLARYSPEEGKSDVPLLPQIELEFSLPVRYDQIKSLILINPSAEIKSVQTALQGRKLIIHTLDTLRKTTKYTVSINRNVQSIRGDKLPHDYNLTFTTGSQQTIEIPRVISFFPGDSARVTDNTPTIRFIFSTPMLTTLSVPVFFDSTQGMSWASLWADDQTLYLLPVQELEESTQYSFTLSSALKSIAGISLGGRKTYYFISGKKQLDNYPPFIMQSIPATESVLHETQPVKIICSEWLSRTAEEWLNVESNGVSQAYNWQAVGQNFFAVSGEPGWKPQSELSLIIDAENVSDNNGNRPFQNYLLHYQVLGEKISRDLDRDGISEYVIDANGDKSDGLEFYQDPGGIATSALYTGDLDSDHLSDFVISSGDDKLLLTWFPAKGDSGRLGYCEKISDSLYAYSTDNDDLVEFDINIREGKITPAQPRIRSFRPKNGTDNVSPFSELKITFNREMDPLSVIQAVAISPDKSGKWSASGKNSEFTFNGTENWQTSTIYTVSLNSTYRSFDGQEGLTSIQFSFRIADSLSEAGNILWQFPQPGDSIHARCNYYIAFSAEADTSMTPQFTLIQDFRSVSAPAHWLTKKVLEIETPSVPQEGPAVLRGIGLVRFLQSQDLEIDITSPFVVSDHPAFKLIRPVEELDSPVSVEPKLSFIFNQPPDSATFAAIHMEQLGSGQNPAIQLAIKHRNNLLSVIPGRLAFHSMYHLQFNDFLRGITATALEINKEFIFTTVNGSVNGAVSVEWQQINDFLVLSWAGPAEVSVRYELYLTDSFTEKPDTSGKSNLYSATSSNSALVDLKQLPQESFLFIRRENGSYISWSKALRIQTFIAERAALLSLALTGALGFDDLRDTQPNLNAISQWNAEIPGWQSSVYLPDQSAWSSNYILRPGRGIMLKVENKGRFAWVQAIPDSFSIQEPPLSQGIYRSAYNPFQEADAADLAAVFGNGTRLAIWDNTNQGWVEAVYDSSSRTWINNFQLSFLEPFYVLSEAGFVISAVCGQNIPLSVSGVGPLPITAASGFPSRTIILKLAGKTKIAEVFNNDYPVNMPVGCGVDTSINFAYINLANLDGQDAWKFCYYDDNGTLTAAYEFNGTDEDPKKIPISFEVDAPYPNPFNSIVTIPIKIPEKGAVDIKMMNILGQQVHSDRLYGSSAQLIKYQWNTHIASGVYFVIMRYKEMVEVRKVVLLK